MDDQVTAPIAPTETAAPPAVSTAPAPVMPVPPAAPTQSSSIRIPIIIGAIVVLLLAAVAAAAYFTGYLPLSFLGSAATSTPSMQDDGDIAWQSIIGESPTLTLTATSSYDSTFVYSYSAYALGTFKKGDYTGSVLYLAEEPSVYDPTTPDAYVYYIGDSTGKPLAWWGPEGSYMTGMGDLDFPPSMLNAPKLATSTSPVSLVHNFTRSFDSTGAASVEGDSLYIPHDPSTLSRVGTATIDNQPVMKELAKPGQTAFDSLQQYQYYAQAPFGALHHLELEPNFIAEYHATPPELTWQTGSTTAQADYNYGHYVYGVSDCFSSFKTVAALEASFTRTGTTGKGDALYEVNPQGHDDVYQCLYKKTQVYDYDPDTGATTAHYPTTYQEFLTTHPFFFWKHPYGEWMGFGRSDVVPAAEKGKPVIYLYPTRTEQVSVKVDPVGGFTKTVPAYGAGWNVTATPSSLLTNLADGAQYPYLFWEGGAKGTVRTPKEGFVVAQAGIPALLDEKLALLGLNAKERADFAAFWVPRLAKAPYYFITFVPKSEMDRVAPLTITPAPDTVIRVLMDYRPLGAPISVQPLQIDTPARARFTVVEWGGILRD